MYKLYIKTNIDSAKLLDIVLKDNNIKKYSIFYNKYGKPYLKKINKYFNISNTKNISVCVFSDKEIGVDIEYIRYNELVMKRMFTLEECEFVNNSKNKAEIFTLIWTIKESYSKLLGLGLNYNFKKIDTFKIKNKINIKKYQNYIVTIIEERKT